MPTATARHPVELEPEAALAMWADVRRWPTFVDGFGQLLAVDTEWPEPGSEVEWRSGPRGRGAVTERVERHEPGRLLATRVREAQLEGLQTIEFGEAEQGGTLAELTLEYELTDLRGPLAKVVDVVFVRRAQRDALRRTLARFAVEAEEEASLAGRPPAPQR